MGKAIRDGILWVSAGILPSALIVATLYRFPIPFRGYIRGWDLLQEGPNTSIELIWLLIQAAIYYILWGGFIVLAVLGTIAGVLGHWLGKPDRVKRSVRNIALGLAFVVAVVLSVLDKIVGAW
ncbi:MAG: hypothetical protein ACLQGP_38670 [Isosphaeraceae bacterium]